MRGFVLIAVVGGLLFAATPAGASTDECNAAVAQFQSSEPRIVRQAGNPLYACVPNNGDGQQAIFDKAANTVYVEEQPSAANYSVLVAHETGHAWAEKRHVTYSTFGQARGFAKPSVTEIPTWTPKVIEDFADTFAMALGYWHPLNGVRVPAPYQFQHEAGAPTAEQLTLLRAAHLLPGCLNDWLPTAC